MILINGEALEEMAKLPDASIDALITDPPYGTTACKWDSVIPFEPMWAQLKRIIKPRGAIVLFGSQPFTSALIMSNVEWFKYCWVWEKSRASGHVHAKNKPMKKHEDIAVFSPGVTLHKGQTENRMDYYPQGVLDTKRVHFRPSGNKQDSGTVMTHRQSHRQSRIVRGENYPDTILNFPVIHNGDTVHPTQKPVKLMEYLIKTYTLEGETVLDFTMGSGSTIVAAKNTGRKGIGIELDPGYFDIAQKRVAAAVRQLEMF